MLSLVASGDLNDVRGGLPIYADATLVGPYSLTARAVSDILLGVRCGWRRMGQSRQPPHTSIEIGQEMLVCL